MPAKRIGPRTDGSKVAPGASFDDARPFTPKQGQYLAFIYYSTKIHGTPPAEADFRRFFRVTPPVVHQMIKTHCTHADSSIVNLAGRARSSFVSRELNCQTWNDASCRPALSPSGASR